jgi:hypothetical protein
MSDSRARDIVRGRLDETLFVEAGAGTGKTTVLVDRIVELVTADGPDLPVPMRTVAAITFTEKAAAELRDRVRRELEDRARNPLLDATVRDRCNGPRRARRCGDLYAPVRAAHPHCVSGRGRAATAHRGPRRGLVAARVRGAVAHARRPARRSRLEPALLILLAAGVRITCGGLPTLDDNWDLLDRIGAPPHSRDRPRRLARRARGGVRDRGDLPEPDDKLLRLAEFDSTPRAARRRRRAH